MPPQENVECCNLRSIAPAPYLLFSGSAVYGVYYLNICCVIKYQLLVTDITHTLDIFITL